MNTELLTFIEKSPTAFHAANNIRNILLENNFQELEESKQWQLEHGQKYFVVRNQSSVIAFTTPNIFTGLQISASHLDSPAFKVKENSVCINKEQVCLDVEKYGGMILSSWFDRPLSLAGRVMVDTPEGLSQHLLNLDEDVLMIPSVAIHLDRTTNDGHKYNVQKELMPMISQNKEFSLTDFIKNKMSINGTIIAMDLFLYNRQKGTTWGANHEFISAPRIDNLECTYALLQGLIKSNNSEALNMCLMFDNEEVGSGTKQGADSSFFHDVLIRIKECFGMSEQEYLTMIAKGFMISADNAHSFHPNYPELYDAKNHPIMNKGVVIKHNANQKYTSDAVSSALFKKLCDSCSVPYQTFSNHSNVLGGSTLGNIANTHVSLNTVDIGLAQLAMHSTYETAGSKDLQYLITVMTYFYNHILEVEKVLSIK